MRQGARIGMGAAALAVVAALGWAFAPRPTAVEVASVTRGDFERHIEEDGRTRVVERYVVSAPLAGRQLRPRLREGDAVRAGDVVAVLAPVLPGLPDARTRAAQVAHVQAAEAGLQAAVAQLAAARVAQAQARAAVNRDEALVPQGFVSPARVEDERWALAAAEQSLAAAQAGVQVARHERDTARAALLAVQAPGAAPFEVRAPAAGQVLRLHVASEAPVALGAPLLELGDTARLEVVAELLTADALQVRPGAVVRIDRWGGSAPLAGRVARVEPGGYTKVSALGVEEQRTRVVVELSDPPAARAGLGDGFRVAVAVRVQAQAGALKVPVSAVFPRPGGAAGEMAVFRVEDGRARQVGVRLGGRNGQEAWIAEGLAEGDAVVVYPARTLGDGQRVKASAG